MRILVVDDELSMREYLEVLLARVGYEVVSAASATDASRLLATTPVDLVITDMKLGRETGLAVLKSAKALPTAPEVIVITAFGTTASAVEAMRQGAYDYILKPFDNEDFIAHVQKALEKRQIVQENRDLRDSLAPAATQSMVGSGAAMRPVWALVDKVAAASKSTVLITGESGVGKEVVARTIHFKSARAASPFVPVNCAALAEGVLESELFGHKKGAFTGANHDRDGILVSAGAGSVLLDEVAEIPLSIQVKLLRVLQERRVKPVGSSSEQPFEARILAATNKDLEAEVRAGRFREDLLFRLNVITIEIPPLRARREDIGPLANFFLARAAETLVRPQLHFAPETLALLESYFFPGNVRQLENFVERAATLSDSDELLPSSLPAALRGEPTQSNPVGGLSLHEGFALERHLDEIERKFLSEALQRAGGVKTKAAELLGLSFRSFRYRLAKHGMADRDDFQT